MARTFLSPHLAALVISALMLINTFRSLYGVQMGIGSMEHTYNQESASIATRKEPFSTIDKLVEKAAKLEESENTGGSNVEQTAIKEISRNLEAGGETRPSTADSKDETITNVDESGNMTASIEDADGDKNEDQYVADEDVDEAKSEASQDAEDEGLGTTDNPEETGHTTASIENADENIANEDIEPEAPEKEKVLNDTKSTSGISTIEPKPDYKQPFELEATFQGFHNFLTDGPRNEPFLYGVSRQQLMDSGDTIKTIGDKPVNVTFFSTKGAYYSAAWLATIETFLANENFHFESDKTKWKKNWNPNLEAGTWAGVVGRMNHRTVDFLDFFVHHLSRYKGPFSVKGPSQKVNWGMYLDGLDAMQRTYEERPFNNPNLDRNGRVLVVCPFHGAKDSHSGQDEKQLQLNITVKALARVFPNVVVTVCDEKNFNYVVNDSGLNEYLYDTLWVKNLTMQQISRCTHLPILSNLQVKRLLENESNEKYSTKYFDWIYYTESDEPPHLTDLYSVLKETLHHNRTVVIPHRSYPAALPTDLNQSKAHAGLKARTFMETNRHKVVHQVYDLRDSSCCFSPPFIKKDWTSPGVQLIKQYTGHAQANGWCSPFKNTCTTCTFRNRTNKPCPRLLVSR